VINRQLLTLCGVVGIFAAIAAPAKAADDIEAKAQTCAACHGANGVPADPKTMPIIWGQQANYLYKELHDYKSGDRKSPIMAPVVADISLPELRQLANYFAAKPWPAKQAAGAAARRLKLRLSGSRNERLRQWRTHQQRRHAGLHEGAVGKRSRRHGEISRRAVIA